MKLSLRHVLFCGAAPAVLALAATGCSGSSSPTPPGGATAPGGGGGGDDSPDGGGAPSAPADPPHALGVITLGEVHPSGGGATTPLVSAAFVPDSTTSALDACTKTVAGCKVPMPAVCDGVAAPRCGTGEVCTLDKSCAVTCQKPCSLACASGEACYFATPTSPACRKVESFDAGALAFAGTTTPITLYPPYSFAGDGSGAPFLAGASIEVQGSGATVAGFDKFDETFKATTFLQTTPSLDKIPLAQVWGSSTIPVGWVPGGDSVQVMIGGSLGVASCDANDASGHFDVPREVVTAVTGTASQELTISVTRKRIDTKKDAKTKGALSTATVQSVGFLQLTTTSTEMASFAGCGTSQTMCGDHCAYLSTSSTDCGACGHSCGTGYCSGGQCYGGTTCKGGLTECSGTCVDLQTSSSDCGYCGNSCPSGYLCVAGVCG